ncbi:MAG: AP endonuclease [Lachnospiraceae bacterium]|nr:AP endonuclease [Lachnospiraceae bacterium]
MNILGVELEFDFFDADQLEAYERENQKVADDIKEPTQYEGKSNADCLRIQCRIVDNFFDNLFGAGTSQKLFNGKANLRDHMEAFGIMAKGAQDSRKELDAIEDKYTPNRAERRAAEQQNRQTQKQNSINFQHRAAGNGKGKGKKHNH